MKIIFTLTILLLTGFIAQPVFSSSFTGNSFNLKEKEITIGSDRKSGLLLLRFKADKKGKASIVISDESGKIVLRQTNKVDKSTNSIPLKNAIALAQGSYTVRLSANDKTYTTRFMVWK